MKLTPSLRVYCLGIALILLGQISGAATTSPSSDAPSQTVSQPQNRAEALWRQGWKQYQENQIQDAIASWEEALQLYQQQGNRLGEMLTFEGLGQAYEVQGKYEGAIAFSQQQLAIARELEDRRSSARVWGNLANNYQALGNYAQALAANQTALQLWQDLGDRLREGQVLGNLGNIYFELGDYQQALALNQERLAIVQAANNARSIVLTLNSLGAIYFNLGKYKEAKEYYQQSLSAAEAINFQSAQASTLYNLGLIHHIAEEFEEAISAYQETLQLAQKLDSSDLEGSALAGLGLAHANLKNYPQSLEYQEQSWQLAQEMGKRPLESIALGNWGYTLWKAGNLPAAEEKLRASIAVRESLRLGLEDADKISIFDTHANASAYSLLQQVLVAQNKPEAALEIAERGRSRAFVELLSQRLENRTALESLNIQPPTLEEIRQIAKAQNATLVEYSIIPDEDFIGQGKLKGKAKTLLIWAIAPTGEISFRQVDLAQAVTGKISLRDLVNRSRLSIGVRGRGIVGVRAIEETETDNRLQQLHQLLIDPIADVLPADPEAKVIFIPHQELFLVPFPALQDKSDRYLIDKHTMLVSPSIQVLQLTRQQRQRIDLRESGTGKELIVGNPTMPDIPNKKGELFPLNSLPGAEAEAIAIAQLLKTEAWTGDRATEASITQEMQNARLIHLATHGLLDDFGAGVPGAIALAPSPGVKPQFRTLKPNDGLLTTAEIVQMNLNAELVVLSACDTGRGNITGDGVIGLSRSFIAAGVPSLIVSLWQVPDEPTADLMSEFYRQRQQHPDKAKALRQAMLSTKEKHSSPRDWGAFTLMGESD